MVKYKVNLKFKDNAKSLNDVITGVLKIEIKNKFNTNNDNLRGKLLSNSTCCFQKDWRMN